MKNLKIGVRLGLGFAIVLLFTVVMAVDGAEGVTKAKSEVPDLILMDIQLPEVSGLQVTQWLKDDEELRHIPVIAITAFAMKGDEEKIREGGWEAYIAKPISVTNFMEVIERTIAYLSAIDANRVMCCEKRVPGTFVSIVENCPRNSTGASGLRPETSPVVVTM